MQLFLVEFWNAKKHTYVIQADDLGQAYDKAYEFSKNWTDAVRQTLVRKVHMGSEGIGFVDVEHKPYSDCESN